MWRKHTCVNLRLGARGVKKQNLVKNKKKSENLLNSREENPVKETYPGKSSFTSHGGQKIKFGRKQKNPQTSKIPDKKNLWMKHNRVNLRLGARGVKKQNLVKNIKKSTNLQKSREKNLWRKHNRVNLRLGARGVKKQNLVKNKKIH